MALTELKTVKLKLNRRRRLGGVRFEFDVAYGTRRVNYLNSDCLDQSMTKATCKYHRLIHYLTKKKIYQIIIGLV